MYKNYCLVIHSHSKNEERIINMSTPRTNYAYSIDTNHYETQHFDEQRVLRDTYTLLALSMVPTILGAHFGLKMVPSLHSLIGSGMIASLILFLGLILVNGFLISLIQRNSNSYIGIFYLALFTGFSGFMASPLIHSALNIPGGEKLVMLAAAISGGILAIMALLANFIKVEHQGFVGFLTIGIGVVFLTQLVGGLFSNVLYQIGCALSVILFSGWILYDIRNVITGSQGNYIEAALSIYISIANIFMNILQLLMMFSGGSSNDD
jgi:modulator of FtsH protease